MIYASPVQKFLQCLEREESIFRAKLASDETGILLRAAINEFDWFHYNYSQLSSPNQEQSENYYFCRLGLTRIFRLVFEAVDEFAFPVVQFKRRGDISRSALELLSAIGMIEHGRRVAHSAKTGFCKIRQSGDRKFHFLLPEKLIDAGYHEKSLLNYYISEEKRVFQERLGLSVSDATLSSIENKLSELVYVFHGHFIGYDADPLIDDYFWGLAYSEIQLQEGFDTFHFSTEFGGVPFQKYMLATIFLVSIALKHKSFCDALVAKAPHIQRENILTISADWDGMVKSIAEVLNTYGLRYEGYTNTSVDEASRIASVLALSRCNCSMLARPHAPLPYLVKVSDTGVVKLIGGAQSEPVHFLLHSLRHHFPKEYDKNQQQREGSFQRALEALLDRAFGGLEFRTNVKVRRDRRVLTDIDFVVIDRSLGLLVLCQLKYQDLYGADIIAQSSRTRRLCEESIKWLDGMSDWVSDVGQSGLKSALQLEHGFEVKRVSRLVLSKHFAHPLGGIRTKENFSYSNWLQLINAISLMEANQGEFRTIAGLLRVLDDQNTGARVVEHLEEPPTKYTIGDTEFTVEMQRT